ncbi:hypothetical protein AVEN_245574-1 [Araneus ventricosus]|uniref:Uncharacterized protein n=1 Tax=Araneus ventricosus TaxID=182803 RepID=A0A4Y2H2S6_ARAVE|nr:hypothetical protein AVEN_245574-1 [Araneus ventricosus]
MERSRITPRLRPRPYDLRRKVLLKNFFREQMTYIPHIRSTVETPLDVNNDSDFDENESNSNTNEGNILTPKKVQDNIVTPISVPEPAPSTSNCSEKENSNNLENSFVDETSSNMSEVEERPPSKSRLSRIIEKIDSRLSSKKNRRRGITKAKHELRSSKGILKPAGRKIIKDTEISTKVKAKSFFERFKSRREKKRNKSTTSRISNLFGSRNSSPFKCDSKVATTSTQSVQTDMSWSPDHYEKMEKSHRSLLEENRLLSESLSSIITNTDFRSSSTQNSCVTDSYTNSSGNSAAYFSHEQRPVTKTGGNGSHSQPVDSSRTRILRSKSMQNRSDKRSLASSRLRTRSLNCRSVKRPYNTDSIVTNEPHCEQQPYKVKVKPFASPVASRAKTRPSVLQSIDASPLYNTNTSSLLQTLSSKSGKAIIRRSSMPERTYNWNSKPRPVRSSSMRENNRYSYTSERVSPRPNQPSPRHRSTTFNGYSCSVPFQDLPAEAFY